MPEPATTPHVISDITKEACQAIADIRAELAGRDAEALLRRPPSGKWSVAEHLDHLVRSQQLINRVAIVLKMPALLLAPLTGSDAPDFEAKNPFDPETFRGANAPAMTKPSGMAPKDVEKLLADLHAGWISLESRLGGMSNRQLSSIKVPFASYGWFNVAQCIRMSLYHEAHHFRVIRQQLAA